MSKRKPNRKRRKASNRTHIQNPTGSKLHKVTTRVNFNVPTLGITHPGGIVSKAFRDMQREVHSRKKAQEQEDELEVE